MSSDLKYPVIGTVCHSNSRNSMYIVGGKDSATCYGDLHKLNFGMNDAVFFQRCQTNLGKTNSRGVKFHIFILHGGAVVAGSEADLPLMWCSRIW